MCRKIKLPDGEIFFYFNLITSKTICSWISLNNKRYPQQISCVTDPGSGAFWTPESGIRNRFFSGSRIPNPYFGKLCDNFLGKKYYSLSIGSIFFLYLFENKINFYFTKFLATKKKVRQLIFSPFLFCFVVGYGMDKNQDPGSGKKIPDPQHCKSDSATLLRPPTNINYLPVAGIPLLVEKKTRLSPPRYSLRLTAIKLIRISTPKKLVFWPKLFLVPCLLR
jgi:hypothetical protein